MILVLVTFMSATTDANAGKDRSYSVNVNSHGVGFSYNKGSRHGKDYKGISVNLSSPRHYTSNYSTRHYGSSPSYGSSCYQPPRVSHYKPQPRKYYVQGYWDTYTVKKFSHYEYVRHYDSCGRVHIDKQPVYRTCTERRWIPGRWVYH